MFLLLLITFDFAGRNPGEISTQNEGFFFQALNYRNKAGYTSNKQSLTGGQELFADGQGQSFGGQGLLCSEISKSANFASSKISRYRPRDTPSHRVA